MHLPEKIVKMTSRLHELGYDSLYLMSGYPPSGFHWRYEIGIIQNGFWPSNLIIAKGSSNKETNQTDWSDSSYSDEDLCNQFLEYFGKDLDQAKVPNPLFVSWFSKVAQSLYLHPNGLLIFYDDIDPGTHEHFLDDAPGWTGSISSDYQ